MKEVPASFETRELREFGEVLQGRRSIELFLQRPVPAKLVRAAIKAATWAPNHHVTEPWHFYLLGPQSIAACLDLCRDIVAAKRDAGAAEFKAQSWAQKPGWLVVSCRRSADALLQEEDLAACAAAVQNFLLYLWKAGVGSKWTTGAITRDPRFYDIVGMDAASERVVGLVWFGYPKLTPAQMRKGLEDVLTERP